MARRASTVLWLALGSCTHGQTVEDAAPDAAAVVVEHDAASSDRWLDFDIADDEEYSVGCAVEQLGALWCWGHDPTLQARLRPQLGPTEARAPALGADAGRGGQRRACGRSEP